MIIEFPVMGTLFDHYPAKMTPRATPSRVRKLSVAFAACLALTACGSVVDNAATEKAIAKKLPELAEADIAVKSVTCPSDVDFVKGATFDCGYVVEDGSEGVVSVEITSEEGDGSSEYQISTYASGQVAEYLLNSMDSDVGIASIECDDPVEDGSQCNFEDEEGDTGTITLTFDDEGNYTSAAKYD